ncbi:MAG: hypothetical protein FJW36_23255 [Acidobacteria bacterium]|nr:hypothetical protein [Acidobacteriota bacterium]
MDWDWVLAKTLRMAADQNADEFAQTLRWMVAQLRDGHGAVQYAPAKAQGKLPLAVEWIEGAWVVVGVGDGVEAKAGDEVVRVNGSEVSAQAEVVLPYVSGATPQWTHRIVARDMMRGLLGQVAMVGVKRPGSEANLKVWMRYLEDAPSVVDARPAEKVRELEPGIWYADLTRMTDADWASSVGDLAKARGIVFDLRGYPKLGPAWMQHLTKTPIESPQWHVPIVTRPGQMEFDRQGWSLQPALPYLEAKRVILTHGGAISYAETTMGMVAHYKLCEIVGETTAGTNGNVNPFVLPGGYRITWTGMKVLKQDGSRHHGVGIAPTVPVARTKAGVAAGQDEVLARGLALVR